jgi:hypothetical protein
MWDIFSFTPVGSDGVIGSLPGSEMGSFLSGGLPFITSSTTTQVRNADGTVNVIVQDRYSDGSADFTVATYEYPQGSIDSIDNHLVGVDHYDNVVGGGRWGGPDGTGPGGVHNFSDLWIGLET